eukprot:365441-Chlamydomonas_euryale.AAC.8
MHVWGGRTRVRLEPQRSRPARFPRCAPSASLQPDREPCDRANTAGGHPITPLNHYPTASLLRRQTRITGREQPDSAQPTAEAAVRLIRRLLLSLACLFRGRLQVGLATRASAGGVARVPTGTRGGRGGGDARVCGLDVSPMRRIMPAGGVTLAPSTWAAAAKVDVTRMSGRRRGGGGAREGLRAAAWRSARPSFPLGRHAMLMAGAAAGWLSDWQASEEKDWHEDRNVQEGGTRADEEQGFIRRRWRRRQEAASVPLGVLRPLRLHKWTCHCAERPVCAPWPINPTWPHTMPLALTTPLALTSATN